MQQTLRNPWIDAFNNVWFGTPRCLLWLQRELDFWSASTLAAIIRLTGGVLWLACFCGRAVGFGASILWRLVLRPVLVAGLAITVVVALFGAAIYNPADSRMSVATSYLPMINAIWSMSFVMLVSLGVVLTALLPILACSYIHYGRTNTLQRL